LWTGAQSAPTAANLWTLAAGHQSRQWASH
jgi:hypothetical protein